MKTAPFAHYLPYWATRTIDTPEGEVAVCIMVDGTFMLGANVTGTDIYSASNAQINKSASALRTAINLLPPGAFLQTIWRTGYGYDDIIDDYAAAGTDKAHAIVKEQRRRRVDMLRKSKDTLVRGKLTYWLGVRGALGDLRRDDASLIERVIESLFARSSTARGEVTADDVVRAASQLAQLQQRFFTQVERSGLKCSMMSEHDLLTELNTAVNPVTSKSVGPPVVVDDADAYSEAELKDKTLLYRPLTLREQLPCGDLVWEDDHYLLDDPPRPHRALALHRLPPLTNASLCLATQFATSAPFALSHTIVATDKEKLTEQMIRRRNMMAAQAAGNVRDIAAEVAIGEFEQMLENMITHDQKLFETATHVVVSGEDAPALDKATREVKQSFADLGAALTTEAGRQHQAAVSTFPGGGPGAPRMTTLMTNNAADLIPYFEPSKGDRDASFVYHTRKSGLRRFSMSDSKQNKNMLVFGASGSGKSFNVAELLEQVGIANGAPVLIIDVQGPAVSNYRVLADLFGGNYTALSAADAVSFNPFFSHEEILTEVNGKKVIDEEKVAYLKKLVCVMALPADKHKDRIALGYDIARTAILRAYRATSKKKRPPLLRDVVAVLDEYESEKPEYESLAREMFLNLSTWIKDPLRARLIDAPRTFEGTSAFQVFDFYGLERDKELATVLLLSVSFYIWSTIQKYTRDVTKFIVFDECWALLTHPVAADIIGELYRTGRKWNASSWAITQDLGDFVNSPVSSALMANSETMILNQHVDNHARVADVCGLTSRQHSLFKALEFKAGEYSELLLVDRQRKEADICRLRPTAFDLWLNTSKPSDVAYRNRVQEEKSLSMLDAIRFCAENHPTGAPKEQS